LILTTLPSVDSLLGCRLEKDRDAATYRAYCSESLTQNTNHTGTSLGADGVNTVTASLNRQTPPITASVTVRNGQLANDALFTTRSVTVTGTPGKTTGNTISYATSGYDLASYIGVYTLYASGPRPNQMATMGVNYGITHDGAARSLTSGLAKNGTQSLEFDPFHDGGTVGASGVFTDGYNRSQISGTNQTDYVAARENKTTLATIQGEARIQRDDNQPTRKVHLWANKACGQTWVNLTKMTLSGSGSGTTTWNAGGGLTINPMGTGMAAASKVNNDTRTQNASHTNTVIFNDCKPGEALTVCNSRSYTATVNTMAIAGTITCTRDPDRPTRMVDSIATPGPNGVKVMAHTVAGTNHGDQAGDWPGPHPAVTHSTDGKIHNTTYSCTAAMVDGYNTYVLRTASVTTEQINGTVSCQPGYISSRHVDSTAEPKVNYVSVSQMFINGRSVKGNGAFQSASAVNQAATAYHNDLPDGSTITCMVDFNDGISARRITSSTTTVTLGCTTGGAPQNCYNGYCGTREAAGSASNPTPSGAWLTGITMGGIGGSCSGRSCSVWSNTLTAGAPYSVRGTVTDGLNTRSCGGHTIAMNSLGSAAPTPPVCGARGSAWNTKSTTVSASNIGESLNNNGNIGGSQTKTVTCPESATFTRTNTNSDGWNSVKESTSVNCSANCTPLPGGAWSPSCGGGLTCTGLSSYCPAEPTGYSCPSWPDSGVSGINGPTHYGAGESVAGTVGGVSIYKRAYVCSAHVYMTRTCTKPGSTKTVRGQTYSTPKQTTSQECRAAVTGLSSSHCAATIVFAYSW